MKALFGYLVIGLLKLMALMPLAGAQVVGRMMGHLLLLRRSRSREVARVNLKLVYPDKTPVERESLMRDAVLHTGMSGAEMGTFWGASPAKGRALVRQVHGLDVMQQALAQQDKGVLICVPHLGNWEILNHYVTTLTPVTAMYRPAKNKVLDAWMLKSREETGIHLVPTTRDGVHTMFAELAARKVVGILPDQEPKPKSGVFANFMGQPTLTPQLPYQLLQHAPATVVFGFAKRLPKGKGFELYFLPADPEIYDADAERSCAAMNRGIADCIALCPEQYQWTYKRFKRRPEGIAEPYKAARVP